MKKTIVICEVGPRDGLQNVAQFVPTETKLQIIDGIVAAGVKRVQCTSFMNPKAVPQMADAPLVAKACLEKYQGTDVTIYALAANRRGVDSAVQCGITELSFVTSASESHNLANVRKSVAGSVAELKEIIAVYPQLNITWDVAMTFGCAFEGKLSHDHILRHIEQGMELGLRSFNLCDSNGIATPDLVGERVSLIMNHFPEAAFRVHIHDTRNMGMVNTLTAINCGITHVEVSLCGLGGCPFFPGASGNTATEDLVYMLNEMGYDTGVDFPILLQIAKYTQGQVGGNCSGHHIQITDHRCYQ